MLKVGSEGDPQKVGELLRADVGHVVERALELMGLTDQEASYQMGYRDQNVITRWTKAIERPLFDKLLRLKGTKVKTFRVAWMLALAEDDPTVDSEMVIRIPLRRRA